MTIDNRKWAIEQAVLAQSKDPVKTAQDFLKFINKTDQLTAEQHAAEQAERGEMEKEWSPKKLSDAKDRVMRNVISRFQRGLVINGVQIAKDLKLTQSCVSSHLADLVRDGYVGRQGNKFWPRLHDHGKAYARGGHEDAAGSGKGLHGPNESTDG